MNPHYLLMSSLVLSEAAFEPLMLASLLGLAVLWHARTGAAGPIAGWRMAAISLGSGVAAGAAVLVRPSWAMFVPMMLAAWVVVSWRAGQGRPAARAAAICAMGVVLVMCPWWVRNARIYGRFVPTALWLEAPALYDGINPRADCGSHMLPF